MAPALRQKGHDVVSVTLPDHGNPGASDRLWSSIGSYVDHVKAELQKLDSEARKNVVLVGHSMGGLVVQRVMETEQVMAGVLVASMPRRGAIGVLTRLTRHDPKTILATTALLSLWPIVQHEQQVRELFFTADADDETVANAHRNLQNESYVAFLSMLTRWPRPGKVKTPVHVIAGELDGVFTLAEQHDLAKAYGVEAVVVDGAGHDLMLDHRWPKLVEEIERSIEV